MLRKVACLFLVVLMNIDSLAAVVSDNDGAAFITKAEFDSLRSEFQKDLNERNAEIDNKISNIINDYLNGISIKSEKVLPSLLNKLSSDRRTFVNNISNPSTSKQENLYISTNGFWTANISFSNRSRYDEVDGIDVHNQRWWGWMFAGLNNYDSEPGLGTHHIRGPWDKNNLTAGNQQGDGKYVFIDNIIKGNDDAFYITDTYLKDLKFKLWSLGSDEVFPAPLIDPTSVQPYDTASISWPDIHYNWTGRADRSVATYRNPSTGAQVIQTVTAAETIYLDIANYSEINWINNMASGAVFTTNAGCLKDTDQYNWSYWVSDFCLGKQGNQVYGASYYFSGVNVNKIVSGTGTNRHTESNETKLNFYVPKISELPCTKLGAKDATDVAGVITYYHSGLPLALIDKAGTIKIKLNITRKNSNKSVTVAIKKSRFDNLSLENETGSDLIFKKTYTPTELSTGQVVIDIAEDKLKGVFNALLWIKAYENSDADGYVILDTSEIRISQSA